MMFVAYLPCVAWVAAPLVYGAALMAMVIIVVHFRDGRRVSRAAVLAGVLALAWLLWLRLVLQAWDRSAVA